MSIFQLRLLGLKCVRLLCTQPLSPPKVYALSSIKQQADLLINQSFNKNENINNENWIKIRKELLNSKSATDKYNVDVLIFNTCLQNKNYTAALNYIEFLKATNYEINIATVKKYFKLIYRIKKSISAEEEKHICKLYDDIKAKYSVIDGDTAESCIMALSLTKRWEECFKLLEMVEFGGVTKHHSYTALAGAVFDNSNDSNTAWKHIHSMQETVGFDERLTESYLNFCNRNATNGEEMQLLIDQMFEYWSNYDIYPETKIIDMYASVMQNIGQWQIKDARINASNGECSECGYQLSDVRITENDFDNLAKTFLNEVLVGKDIYNTTTPKELEIFKNFVNATKPYDVVIDGLNMAYMSTNHRNKRNPAASLANIVSSFVKENKKIFVLGRMHMKNWSERDMNYVRRNAHLFLINDLSSDDQFLLYAAFSSGMNTYFSSRDFMRQHKFTLGDPYLRKIFRHWQLTRQITPEYVGRPHNTQIVLVYPPKFIPTLQKNVNGDWHIPYDDTWNQKEIQPFSHIKSWKCFKKLNIPIQHDISIKSIQN